LGRNNGIGDSVYIKNADTVSHTYQGQIITASSYYLVQESEANRWTSDSDLIKDIANGLAVVARLNDGNDDITDVNEAISYLKSVSPIIKTQKLLVQGGASNKFLGFKFTATKTTATTYDFKIAEDFYLHSGGSEVDKPVAGDLLDMYVVDVDGIVYPAGTVLKHYVITTNIHKNGLNSFDTDEKTASNLKNFYIRVKYTSVGTVDDTLVLVNMRGFDS